MKSQTFQSVVKRPIDGVYGVSWSRIPDRCLRPFVDQDHRLFERVNERELSNLTMHLSNLNGDSMRVQCMDVSPVGFRIQGIASQRAPTPGDQWKLKVPSLVRGDLEIPVRMVWSQKRASYPQWEAGLERRDLVPGRDMLEHFPTTCISMPFPGSSLLAFVEHPLLFQEWIRCEIIRLNREGEVLMVTSDATALAFGGDIQALRLATPSLRVKPHRIQIKEIGILDGSLVLRGCLTTWSRHEARNLATSLHQADVLKARELLKGGFDLDLHASQVDVQGLSLATNSDRRVLGAFVDDKLIATLAYCLPEEGKPHLFIEGLSLQTESLNRRVVPDRLFTVVARALILSDQERLEIQNDESQLKVVRKAGFKPCDPTPGHPPRYYLSRNDVLWGLGKSFIPWLCNYRPMVIDLVEKGLIQPSVGHRLYLAATEWLVPLAKGISLS